MLLLEEARRQTRSDEAVSEKILPLHPLAAVESGELVGECRRGELGQAHPIRIIVGDTTPRAVVEALTVAQRPLAIEMSDEIALLHRIARPPVPRSQADRTRWRFCAALKAINFFANAQRCARTLIQLRVVDRRW